MKVQSQFIEMAGDLPKNGTLSDYCEMKAGKSIKSDSINSQYNDGLYPCYGGNGLRGYVETYSHDGVYNIIGRQGALCGNITLTKGKFYATEHAIVVRPKTPINEYWLYFALAQMNLNQYARGVAQPGLAVKQLEKLPFGIPSKGKQEKFAAVYQQADKSKFVGFKSQFIEMFGNCLQVEKLSSLCDTFLDGDWIESKDQSDEGIRLVQTGNVGNGIFKNKEDKCRFISDKTFDRLHCTEIFSGDILVSRLPDPIGRACMIPNGLGRMITAVDCSIIRLKESILPDFFIAYTMTPTYRAQINEVTTGTTRRRVSRANLGNVKVPVPPMEQQQQFVSIAHQADKSKYFKLTA